MNQYRYSIFLESPEIILKESRGHWPSFVPGSLRALQLFSERSGVFVGCGGTPSAELKSFLLGEGIEVAWIERDEVPVSDHLIVLGLNAKGVDPQCKEYYLSLEEEGSWGEITRKLFFPERRARVSRKTNETFITVELNLDGSGDHTISTGLAFFDHMLAQLSRHSKVDLQLTADGDLEIDEHHTIEDTALALGEAFEKALGEKRGIARYAYVLPMDDCLAQVAIDFSGRPWLVWDAEYKREKIGDMPTEMFYHFFKSFSDTAKLNLNVKAEGENEHHKIESTFKALGRCIGQAVKRDGSLEIPSTKGSL